jgi:hypothetical protein
MKREWTPVEHAILKQRIAAGKAGELDARNKVIAAALRGGLTQTETARAFGLSCARIGQIWRRRGREHTR